MRDLRAFDLARQSRQAEVRQQHLAAAVQHDVGGLQIAMQHALLVGRGETGAEFARDLQGLVAGKPADAAQQRAEVLAIDVFHGEEIQPLHFAEIVHATDVGVRHLARDADLAAESLERRLVVRDRLGQKLERHRLVERQVVGAVDLAHAALAEHGDDAVAPAEQFSGSEAALRPRTGRRAARPSRRAARNGLGCERIGAAGRADTAGALDVATAGGALGHER